MSYEEKMMENDAIIRMVKIVCLTIVLLAITFVSCHIFSPPDPTTPTDTQQCATLCGSRTVDKFIAKTQKLEKAGAFDNGHLIDVPMECICGGGIVGTAGLPDSGNK